MSIRVLPSVVFCFTLKIYRKGAPFYNAWESRVCCGISKCGGSLWKSRDRTFPRVPPRVISTTKLFSGSCGEPVFVGCCRWFLGWSAGGGGISPSLRIRVERIGEHYANLPGRAMRSGRRGAGGRIIWSSQVFSSLIGGHHVVYI
jgi:hypothetical protein